MQVAAVGDLLIVDLSYHRPPPAWSLPTADASNIKRRAHAQESVDRASHLTPNRKIWFRPEKTSYELS